MVKVLGSKASIQFKKSVKRLKKRGVDLMKLTTTMKTIEHGTLKARHHDHALKGDWKGYRECHIEGDWLLVYRFEGDTLIFVDTGTHADIFGM